MKLLHIYPDHDRPLSQGLSLRFQKYKPNDKLFMEIIVGIRIKDQSVSLRLAKGWKSWIYYSNFRDKEWYFPDYRVRSGEEICQLGNAIMKRAFSRIRND